MEETTITLHLHPASYGIINGRISEDDRVAIKNLVQNKRQLQYFDIYEGLFGCTVFSVVDPNLLKLLLRLYRILRGHEIPISLNALNPFSARAETELIQILESISVD